MLVCGLSSVISFSPTDSTVQCSAVQCTECPHLRADLLIDVWYSELRLRRDCHSNQSQYCGPGTRAAPGEIVSSASSLGHHVPVQCPQLQFKAENYVLYNVLIRLVYSVWTRSCLHSFIILAKLSSVPSLLGYLLERTSSQILSRAI